MQTLAINEIVDPIYSYFEEDVDLEEVAIDDEEIKISYVVVFDVLLNVEKDF